MLFHTFKKLSSFVKNYHNPLIQNIYQKKFDELTGLLDRSSFISLLKKTCERAKEENKELALLILNIDGFSRINEAFGYKVGDEILKKVAKLLKETVGQNRPLGRIGVDEFGIIILSDNAGIDIKEVIDKVKKTFSYPVSVGSTKIIVSFSFGISVFPYDAKNHIELIANASSAVFNAKRLQVNRGIFFSSDMKATKEAILLEADLRNALLNGELSVFYQPKINLETGNIEGLEALLRWKKDGKFILPGKFIPLLEKSKLIHEVTFWLLKEICNQIRIWKEKNINLSIAVNISPVQLKDKVCISNLVERIFLCEDYHLLEIEITESAVMDSISLSADFIKTLSSKRVKVYIDDFGTGYTSLRYLKELPVYALKIDREFVKNLPEDKNSQGIVKAIILLAKTFGMKTVAEGVEKREQVEFLKELGCEYAQGFLFSKPVPPEEIEQILKNKNL